MNAFNIFKKNNKQHFLGSEEKGSDPWDLERRSEENLLFVPDDNILWAPMNLGQAIFGKAAMEKKAWVC